MNHHAELYAKYSALHDADATPLEFLMRYGNEIQSKLDMAALLRDLYGLSLKECVMAIGDYLDAIDGDRMRQR